MPFIVNQLTVEDFNQSGWRDVLVDMTERKGLNYSAAFYEKAQKAQLEKDSVQEGICTLLGGICSMYIDPKDITEPLKPTFQFSDGSSSSKLSDFDDALSFLAKILPSIDDDKLRSRIGDVLWMKKKDYKAARCAVESYLAMVNLKEKAEWFNSILHIQRAITIAKQTNQRSSLKDTYARIEEALASYAEVEQSSIPSYLMKLLQKGKHSETKKYASLAGNFATSAEKRGDWYIAREYWDIQAAWYKIAKDYESERGSRLLSIETYISEGESRIRIPNGEGYMIAAHFYEEAIQALRCLSGQNAKIEDLHKKLLEYQQQGVKSMKPISHEIDLSEAVEASIKDVSGKNICDALFGLAMISSSPKVETLQKRAEESMQNSILSMMSMEYVNSMGRTTARHTPNGDHETQEELSLRIEMHKIGSFSQSLQVQGLILPALHQLLSEHTVDHDAVMAIVRDNPFVPAGREELFAQGLKSGFQGDFATATHLLIPQIENSIRFLLYKREIITSSLDVYGIQDELNLNSTLRIQRFTEPLSEILGEDTVFDLRGLLIEAYGSNLRNKMAHGLLDDNECHSFPCVYLWWLAFRFCYIPVISASN